MVLEGDLESTALPEVLERAGEESLTGILTIQGENDIVAISFLQGEIVAADALNKTLEEALGDVLIEEELVSKEAFDALISQHQTGTFGTLSDLLVGKEVLTRDQLLEAFRVQTYRLLLEVLRWQSGEYKFYSGDEVSYEEGMVPLPVDEVLFRSSEDLGGGGEKLPELNAVYRRCTDALPIKVRGRDGDGESEGEAWLTEVEAAFLQQIDGVSTALAATQRGHLDRYLALYCLRRLLRLGLVERAPTSPLSLDLPESDLEEPLGEAVFRPPEPASSDSLELPTLADLDLEPQVVAESRPHWRWPETLVYQWLAAALALVLTLCVLAGLWLYPDRVLLPLKWQEEERHAVQHQLREAQYEKIRRAASHLLLMEARFPDSLQQMVELGLLHGSDLRDPGGQLLVYSADGLSFALSPFGRESEAETFDVSESGSRNFHLDLQLTASENVEKTALFLID